MMNLSFLQQVEGFVESSVADFHQRRSDNIVRLSQKNLIENKNPYLFRAKNFMIAADLVSALLEARLSSAEEGMFGDFMEQLAVFVSEQKCSGQKSSTEGIDIDLSRDGVRYLIAVKSGKNWGNSTQHKKQREHFAAAVRVLKQNRQVREIQPTLGICYGKFMTSNNGLYLHIGGQAFWELISREPDLYKDIIEPIGYKAREFNDEFEEKKTSALNRMTREFTEQFCLEDGAIDWPRLVELVSKNRQSPAGKP